eukprot:gene1214-1791_t
MDDITWDKYTFSQWLRDYLTALSSGRIRPFTYVERLARAATRNEPWGPHGCLLTAVAKASHRREDCEIVFLVLKKRFRVEPARWRNIYKSLGLIEFVATRGSDHAVKCSEDLLSTISGLKTFQYKDKSGKDEGLNVRHKAKAVEALLLDKSNLDVLRSRAVKAYWGVGADDTLPDLGDELSDEEQFAEGDIPGEGMEWSPSSSFASSSSSVAPSKQPQAGQTKGVTKEIEAKNRRALALLLKRCVPGAEVWPETPRCVPGAEVWPETPRNCADCFTPNPLWASINCGTFICMVAFMAFTGNKLANGHYESALPEGFCRPISGNVEGKPTAELNAFVRDKYNNRFVAPGSEWPPPPPAEITEALAAAPPLLMTSSNSSSLKDLRKVINMNDLQPAKSRSSSAGSLKAPATPPGDPEVHPTRGSTEDTVQMLSAELGMLSPPSSSAPHGEVQLDPGMRPINQEKVEPDFFAQLVHQRTSENGAEKAAAPFTASDVATPSTAAFDLFGDLEIDAQV